MAEEETQEATVNPEAGTETAAPPQEAPAEAPAESGSGEEATEGNNLEFLMDVPVKLTAELGSCMMTMQELLDLDLGAVVQLDQPANANVDVYVNHKLVARGEVVVAEEDFGIRIKEIVSKP
ncbi:MAG: flagellar motor switch protein FliN [Verrucomicrobiota bacterium]|nr:flagellar motor switch protein FliN [Verrucomicrobiota bacterium]MEE2813378.1 flagellar motor switch protein FliN [Verrucomicrobiota bacterium]